MEYDEDAIRKRDRCVEGASTTMWKWAAAYAAGCGAVWMGLDRAFPKFAAVNWRVKAVASCVVTISLGYHKGERALIDCTQDYELRAHRRRQLEKRKLEEEMARQAAQKQ